MKKSAIITFHSSNNNGSFMQAYALQNIIKRKFNIENEIIDLQTVENQNLYKILRPIKKPSDVMRSCVSIVNYRRLKKRKQRFENMRYKYLSCSKKFTDEMEAVSFADKYDCVIAGSDQIWNIKAHDFSVAYFLPGVKTKKITYAVSCGSSIENLDFNPFASYIKDFDKLSVREAVTSQVISEFYEKSNIEIVLDPTLLLDEDSYGCLYDKKDSLVKTPYIFLYSIDYNSQALKTAARISKIMKLPIVTVFNSYHAIICHRYRIKIFYDAGPAEFLNLLKNAAYVLTNSFHGTAFSIIFKKNFYYLGKADNNQAVRDDRIDGIMEMLDIHQKVYTFSDDDYILEKRIVNYENTDKLLENLRSNSLKYLSNALLSEEDMI